MKSRCRELREQGEALFTRRLPLMSIWQDIAMNFYVERADFTTVRSIGSEFASHLMTGVPAMARRDLGNQISAMLRPRGKPWFHARTQFDEVNRDASAKQWLDEASEVQRLVMYDTHSGFTRATREADHDFAAFGQAVISVEPNKMLNGMLFRCWHLRDVAWLEDENLIINLVHRKYNMQARNIVRMFKGKPEGAISQKVVDLLEKEPATEIKCHHIVMPDDEYDLSRAKNPKRHKFISIHIDVENDTILEEVPLKDLPYVIPRWQTVSGSQYAYSPATVICISDARLLQDMTLTLLEAGQKYVDPSLIAVGEKIIGGVNTAAGQITYVDADYDERTGEVLRPLVGASGAGLNFGVNREKDIREIISEAFYLNQIQLPDTSGDKTAYEIQKRVEEYIRRALPLFEPMETEYNGALCDKTFSGMLQLNMLGGVKNIPQILQGKEVRFVFESPLQAGANRANSQAFTQTAQLLQLAAQIDPMVVHDVDIDTAFRDAVEGTGAPSKWLRPEEQATAIKDADKAAKAQQAQIQAATQQLSQGADVAGKIGGAIQSFQSLNNPAQPGGQQASGTG